LPEPFTTKDLAAALGEPQSVAQKIVYALREMGAMNVEGKRRNAILYAVRNL